MIWNVHVVMARFIKKCCKNKDFKWTINKDGEISRIVKVSDIVMEGLEEIAVEFEDTFGRELGGNDKIFYTSILNQFRIDTRFVHIGRKAGIAEDKLYATYKTGVILTESNEEKMPDKDIKEWNDAVKEFNEFVNGEIGDEEINVVRYVLLVNDILEEFIYDSLNKLELGISKFIVDNNDGLINYEDFKVDSQDRFVEFCLYKTMKNLNVIKILIEESYAENIFATVRSIYESYLNLAVYARNSELF